MNEENTVEKTTHEEIKPISEKTLQKIFGDIGLDREQIVALTKGRRRPEPRIVPRRTERPKCLVCGQPINARNCKPFRAPSQTPIRPIYSRPSCDNQGIK